MFLGIDVDGMCEWVNNVMVKGFFVEYRVKFGIKLCCFFQEVGKNIIIVKVMDGDDEYGIWVYEFVVVMIQ